MFSHALPNAPIATNLAGFPIILYDPGGSDYRCDNTDKAEELASWGYVVVGLDTSDSYVSVFPNGQVVYGQSLGNTIGDVDAAIEGRLLDMQRVLGELESLNTGDPRFGGRLNLDEIGAFGWSLGGATSAQLCLRDPRCKAGAAMDGYYFESNLLTQPLNVPWLYFAQDGPCPYPGALLPDGRPEDRWQAYNAQMTNAYWVKLASTVHGSFTDYALILDSATLESGWGTPRSGQFLPGAKVSQIVRAYLVSFFNKFLQGEDDHLLDGPPPAYPEVEQFLSTDSHSAAPAYPAAALVQANDGSFYGTTEYGGTNGHGTVFQVTTNGTLTTLVSFNGTNGSHPAAALVQGRDGNFYGTTENGGNSGNNGTVFQMTPAGRLRTLVSFNGTNGSYPVAGLVQGNNGNFYGTTMLGGTNSRGTVFTMTAAGALATLVAFNNGDGAVPLASLVQSTNGNFYGTTSVGGDLSLPGGYGEGTVFKMTSAGVLTALVSFIGANGYNPSAGLVQGSDGNFYGTTFNGGNLSFNAKLGFGTLFQMTPAGVLTTQLMFGSTNGGFCASSLLQGSDGNFYGTSEGGGAGGGGAVFMMTPAGVLTTLVSFNGANGSGPAAGLVQGTDGNFYGTTEYGGANGMGTVFQVTPAGTLTTLVSFGSPTTNP